MKKIFGIFIITLLIVTTLVSATRIYTEEIISQSGRGTVYWSQYPHQEEGGWHFYPSSEDSGLLCVDRFGDVNEYIREVRWWGISKDTYGTPCDPTGMTFNIFFLENDQGLPGDTKAVYTSLSPILYETPRSYGGFTLYEFFVELTPGVILDNDWIGIISTGSPNGCQFFWSNSRCTLDFAMMYPSGTPFHDSLAFELAIPGPDPVSNINYYGDFSWHEVSPGELITSEFQIMNFGEQGSVLDWQITEWPDWGTWSFTPMSGTYLLSGDIQKIQVSVVAPQRKNKEFHGQIKIINMRDPPDYILIDTVVQTPANSALNFDFELFNRILGRFPNAFPVLKSIFGY